MSTNSITELEALLRAANERLRLACYALTQKHRGGEWEQYDAAHAAVLMAERALAAAKGEPYAVPIDFPIKCDAGAPSPFLLQNEYRTFLTFYVRVVDPKWDGKFVTVIDPADTTRHELAVVEFIRCMATRMGTPNDEVHAGHPLSGKGLDAYSAQLVVNSKWIAELEAINSVHRCYCPTSWQSLQHYVFWFHDSTFECVAQSIQVQTFDKSMPELLAQICGWLVE